MQSDLEAIRYMCKIKTTDIIDTNPVGDTDAKMLLLTRNPGKLRLGLFIAILRDDVSLEHIQERYPYASYIMTMLGFVDKVVDFVVNY